MEIKSEFISILVIFVFISLNLTEKVDFCESFIANNNRIKYGFQYEKDEKSSDYYFFIDSNYWRLEFKSESSAKTFTIQTESIGNNQVFDESFVFPLSVQTCIDPICLPHPYLWRTGLYHNQTIIWVEVEKSSSDELIVKNYNKKHTDLSADIDPMLAFHGNWPKWHIICFLQQKQSMNGSAPMFTRDYRCFGFEQYMNSTVYTVVNQTDRVINDLEDEMKRKGIPYGSKETILNNIEDSREVIAIFEVSIGYIFFHIENKEITYCFSDRLFNKGCSISSPKVLIDCSNYTETTYSTQTPSFTQTSSVTENSILNLNPTLMNTGLKEILIISAIIIIGIMFVIVAFINLFIIPSENFKFTDKEERKQDKPPSISNS